MTTIADSAVAVAEAIRSTCGEGRSDCAACAAVLVVAASARLRELVEQASPRTLNAAFAMALDASLSELQAAREHVAAVAGGMAS